MYTNYEEYLNGTDPRNNDTDGDGMPDGWEAFYGLNPNSDEDSSLDFDSDGYDSDGDGEISPDEKFTNYEEFLMDSNPSQADTDGDNCGSSVSGTSPSPSINAEKYQVKLLIIKAKLVSGVPFSGQSQYKGSFAIVPLS